jgi:pimeloyl-ACP methyl ester carboxylesterase
MATRKPRAARAGRAADRTRAARRPTARPEPSRRPAADTKARPAGGPPLTARGAGLILGGLALGIGAGITAERILVRRDRRRPDPEAGERFGAIRGKAATITSHDGTKLHVEELGSGPCLVFAHGFSLTQDAWHYQRRDLPTQFRCVFFDQRGHGRSGRPDDHDYSLDALAGDLAAVLDWTGERRLVLVAHSMGGMASLKLAELEPERFGGQVAGLALVDSTYADALKGMSAAVTARGAASVQRATIRLAFKYFGQDPVRAAQLRRRGSDLGYLGTRLFGFGSNPSPGQVAFIDRMLAGTDIEVWAKVFPSLIDFDLSHVLEQLDLPTLVAVGDADRLTPPASARHMAETIPGARLLILSDAGHLAFLEEHEVLGAELTALAGEALDPARRRRRPVRLRRRGTVRRVPGA